MTAVELPTQVAEFGDLQIQWDARVLRPRWWTTAQSYWAADLAASCPEGPILELCCGAGQIGLLTASLTGRPLIQVDRDPVAAAYARRNAAAAGVLSDVREAPLGLAMGEDERVGLVILDPPWVPTARVQEFPEDPIEAIDGGNDGTDQLVLGLGVAMRHLDPGGHIVAQVGDYDQVTIVEALLAGLGGGAGPRWTIAETRDYTPEGVLVDIVQELGR
ncbi:methyltransferase [Nocardioides stalactiti]|uniref:methyltransferase n=1 Tax=Nocardioides stalactiti TaxID=2755356 RepID=UPI001600A2CE|nr:methyltransferase [Nocardioides stalactiti]